MRKLACFVASGLIVLLCSGCGSILWNHPFSPEYITVDAVWPDEHGKYHTEPQRAYWNSYYGCYTYGDVLGFHCVK